MIIRLWKLGSLEHKILPTDDAIEKFKKVLLEAINSGKAAEDIIWGPAIEVMVVDTEQGIDKVVRNESKLQVETRES